MAKSYDDVLKKLDGEDSQAARDLAARFQALRDEGLPIQLALSRVRAAIDSEVAGTDAARLNELPTTDAGQGEAIARLHGKGLRYDHTRKRWLVWDGVRWAKDTDDEARRLALDTARQRQAAALAVQESDGRANLMRWAISSENNFRLSSALALAAIQRPIATTTDKFDRGAWLLACKNGVVDLRTGELRPGRQDDMLSLSTEIRFDPGAECPRWLRFLEEIFCRDRDLTDFVQRAVGYSMTGSTREQCLFLCYGTGGNGKTVFLTTLRKVLGEGEHAVNTPFDTFVESYRAGREASNDVAALRGARLVTASEVREGRRLNEGRIKSLTGGDPVTARFLYSEFFTFTPAFKLWLACNHKPIIRGTDEAIWRRIRLIPFNAFFRPEDDPALEGTLTEELPGILTWAVEGCLVWQKERLGQPKAVAAATQAYRSESDIIAAFLEECTISKEGASVKASDLHARFRRWCAENGEHELSRQAFGRRLTDRGMQRGHRKDGWLYSNIGLLADGDGYGDGDGL